AAAPLSPAPSPRPSNAGEELVSACLMARTNALGNGVSISLRARPELAPSPQEAWAYRHHEGAFMGNLFGAVPVAQVCAGPDGSTWLWDPVTGAPLTAGRLCTEDGNCGFEHLGSCASVCDVVPGGGEALYDECAGHAHVINTFLYSVVDFEAYDESHLLVDDGPSSVASGDFNGDGTPDLATASYVTGTYVTTGNTVSVLLGTGHGAFAGRVSYPVGTSPRSIRAADFNGDGRTDLATANYDSHDVTVLLARADGTFGAPTPYALGTTPLWLAAGDFNGDGKPDLATANTSSNVSVLLARGDGTFAAPVAYPVPNAPSTLQAADFNGDGKLDLAAGGGSAAGVLLGQGNGTFAAAVSSALPSARMAAGDFNGDGKADLASCVHTTSTNTVSVLLSNGNGTFTAQNPTTSGLGCASLVAADLDGDGAADLASADLDGDSVSVYPGTGTGALLARGVSYYPVPRSELDAPMVAVGDFDRDGTTDLAIEDNSTSVIVRLGQRDGTFGAEVHYDLGSSVQVRAVIVADLDRDGKLDLVTANLDSLSVLMGRGDGTFAPAVKYPVATAGGLAAGVVAADFNGDGKLDLATNLANGYGVFLGNGNGTFGPQASFGGAPLHQSVVAGDWNGDGKVDLASVYTYGSSVYVAWGNGNGTFGVPVVSAGSVISARARSLTAGDFNRDGKADLAVAIAGDETVRVMLGQANGTFASQTYPIAGGAGETTFVGAAYLDGDAALDLMVIRGSSVVVLSGSPAGTFTATGTFTVGESARYLVAGHFDRDPLWRVDLLASSDAGRLVLLPGEPPPAPCTPDCSATSCGQPDPVCGQACGSPTADGCACGGDTCAAPGTYLGGVCQGAPTMADGCACTDGNACTAGDTYHAGVCQAASTTAHCSNGVLDCGETRVDCGGPDCGACTPTIVGTQVASAAATGSTGLTIARPGSLQDGDVLYAFVSKSDNAGVLATPAGWTQLGQWRTVPGHKVASGVWRKVVTVAAAEPTSYLWTFASTATQMMSGYVVAVRGANTTAPEDVQVVHADGTANPTPSSPAATTARSSALVLLHQSLTSGALATVVAPAGTTLLQSNQAADGNSGLAYFIQAIPGSTGVKTWPNLGGSGDAAWHTLTVAVRPR
ncbi:MAG TPA: VCBS repeat-containing protein, partial [Kofleriaceae bacterium]|nr:VCBS repeat-containing protein [Kofleriaceae bacterium]